MVVELSGGNDGLNTVVPTGDDDLLPGSGPTSESLPTEAIPIADGFGFHPVAGWVRTAVQGRV